MEVFRRAGADQPFPDVAMADQPRDPAQHLDVLTGGGLGTDDEEEEPDRLSVQGIERDGRCGNARDHTELAHRG